MKIRKILLLSLLTTCVTVKAQNMGFGSPSWYDFRDQSFVPDLNNYGTFYNPIVIDTPEKLAQLSWLVNEQMWTFAGRIITLGADIDLNKTVNGERVRWVPIGYYLAAHFDGMFIGMEKSIAQAVWQPEYGHRITGMYIDLSSPRYSPSYVGLFGYCRGYVGHLTLTDCTIHCKANGFDETYIGLVCGRSDMADDSDEYVYQEMWSSYFKAPSAIYNVSAEGSIHFESISGHFFVGGIVGGSEGNGVCHSTADVDVTYGKNYEVVHIGGICGRLLEPERGKAAITDCAANITLSGEEETMLRTAGGIVGEIEENTGVAACTSSGTMSIYNVDVADHEAVGMGGIVGLMHQNSHVEGCVSKMLLDGRANVGGIVGYISDETGENTDDALINGCMFAGHLSVFYGLRVGGILGGLNTEGEAIGLYVDGCLMAGTMEASAFTTDSHVAAIAGWVPDNLENVGGCYVDSVLFSGHLVGNSDRHASIRRLATDDLTSGNLSKMSMLPSDDSAEFGFKFNAGYYPQVFCHKEWPGYKVMDDEYNQTALKLSTTFPYWKYESIDKSNCVYEPGAWLASLPITMPKGDAAYDLVTYVVGSARENTWTDGVGRQMKVKGNVTYLPDVDCISVSGDTARVVANGTFKSVYTLKADKNIEAVFNRPLPIVETKQLFMNATPDQEWDGTVATGFAAGTGKVEDPYIIKNGAQLAYAVMNNEEGQFYKQLCDITLVKNLINYASAYMSGTNYSSTDLTYQSRLWGMSPNFDWNPTQVEWKARYNGDGHLVRGAYINIKQFGLFGSIAASGFVENLGLADCVSEKINSGLLAYKMDGTVRNCLLQGVIKPLHNNDPDSYLGYSGGICAYVGPTNDEAIVEDCVSAVYSNCTVKDYTPFVSLPESGNALQNHGKVKNCLAVVPTSFGDASFNYKYTAAGHNYIEDCYWLRGYEPTKTGYTLEDICSALGSRKGWTYSNGYFPTLKTFAQSDIARLMTIPVRTDVGYDDGYDQYLLGFDRQLLFEPGSGTWTFSDTGNNYIEADGDMGIVVPVSSSYDYKDTHYTPTTRYVLGQQQMITQLGKATYAIPVRTRGGQVNPGITIEDEWARTACHNAFDTDQNGVLSLDEVKTVDADALNQAFQHTQATNAKQIQRFPELRFFKNVTSLTTQLHGLTDLTEVKLPYALEQISSDAFSGCTNLKEVTIPARVTTIDQHPFYGSAIENVSVDPFNADFKSRDGILYDVNDVLIAYPNGRTGDEIVLEGRVNEIADGAIYLQGGLQKLYFETDDYETVPYLNYDGIVTTDGELIDVYVSDATYGSVLMDAYYSDGTWDEYVDAGKLHCYYPLNVGSAQAATMYIGFDTELPTELTPYIVTSTDDVENKAYLRSMDRRVPSRTPVVIMASAPGKYRLLPLADALEPWKMYQNRLNGVGRDGMPINQGDSDRGSILTLGYNSANVLGFFYYKGSRIAPYRAYLTYDWLSNTVGRYVISFADEAQPTGIDDIENRRLKNENSSAVYDLQGRRVSVNGQRPTINQLSPGIYIVGGKKILVRP